MTKRHEVRLLGHESCGSDIVTVRFSRPAGYDFTPGQWFTLTLNTAEGPETKTFSHCSAPADEYLEMTTRLSGSSFKRTLESLVPGDRAVIAGPGGRLALADEVQKVCFLIGGVGITPVRSILRHAALSHRTFEDALLVYGNRDASCVPFLPEFERMAPQGLRTVVVYETPPPGWGGEEGFITAELASRHLPDHGETQFFVAGPPVMVAVMERILDELQVPVAQRHVERFGPAAK